MGRKRKPAMEKFRDWAQIKPPETKYSFVDFLDIDEIDAAILLLVDMRIRHPDISEENTKALIDKILLKFEVLVPYKAYKCIPPRKFEADSLREFLNGRLSFYLEFIKNR